MAEETSNKVVSFVDKQLAITQKRHTEMEKSLSDMMAAIEDNARLQLNLHDLTLEVMRFRDLNTAVEHLCLGLKQRFDLQDVRVWGQTDSLLPQPVPTQAVQDFMHYMQGHPIAAGTGERFPRELWSTAGVVSACAFALRGRAGAFGVMVLGRKDDAFASDDMDTLFLQQFVAVMALWLESLSEGK